MFEDLNVLYRVNEGLRGDPEHEAALTARWAGFMAWSADEMRANVAARRAYMFTYLDRRPPDCRPSAAHPRQPPSRRWHAMVAPLVAPLAEPCYARTPAEREAARRALSDKFWRELEAENACVRISCACESEAEEGEAAEEGEQAEQADGAGAARKRQKQERK
jgi:hypothetical protein